MDIKQVHGSKFYIDDITRELSKKYDVNSYRGCFQTLGEANTEFAVGRFLFLAKMTGEIVGVDIEAYRKEFPEQEWYDSPLTVHSEKDIESYARLAQERIGSPVLRKEGLSGKNIYFPTESLVKKMLTGTEFISFDKFRAMQRRRN